MVSSRIKFTNKSINPIFYRSWSRSIPVVKAKKPKKEFELLITRTSLPKQKGFKIKSVNQRFDLTYKTKQIGVHAFPPSIRTINIRKQKIKKSVSEVNGFRPDHLAKRPTPKKLAKNLQVRKRYWQRRIGRKDNLGQPTSVFAPDTRYTFSDTSFPWSTCGRVDTQAGWGSGVMIGPRHLMTASHVVNWKPGNTAGWLKFTPLYFDGSEPFGIAYANRIYWWNKADGSNGINEVEGAFDYVICVLDRRIGDITGWMGSRGYSSSWNGGSYWAHVGYPSDMAGGQRPAFHGNGVMDSTKSKSASGRSSFLIKHKNDIWPGQSGGPFFGWWSNEPWPRVVSSQSAEKWGGPSGPNACGGGNPLPELINIARNNHP